jgi:hypothetical protein
MENLAVSVNPSRSIPQGNTEATRTGRVRRDYTRGPAVTDPGLCILVPLAGEDIVRPAPMVKVQSQAEMTWPRATTCSCGVTESADDFAFGSDLVTFRAILRGDGNLIDTSAIKLFKGNAS